MSRILNPRFTNYVQKLLNVKDGHVLGSVLEDLFCTFPVIDPTAGEMLLPRGEVAWGANITATSAVNFAELSVYNTSPSDLVIVDRLAIDNPGGGTLRFVWGIAPGTWPGAGTPGRAKDSRVSPGTATVLNALAVRLEGADASTSLGELGRLLVFGGDQRMVDNIGAVLKPGYRLIIRPGTTGAVSFNGAVEGRVRSAVEPGEL